MEIKTAEFHTQAHQALANPKLQRALRRATGEFIRRRQAAFADYPEGQQYRDQAKAIKEHTLAHLDHYLVQLEENVKRCGGMVHWARDGAEARRIIIELAKSRGVDLIVKSKSMTTEEMGLNHVLEHEGLTPVETDLGEYIVQLARETPSHIIAPAIHKSREDVSELFEKELGVGYLKEVEELTQAARRTLREKFCQAGMGISGVNFAVAETGTLVVVENEGNARLSMTLPSIHVAVMGIEKVIPTFSDLAVFLRVLARSATGQKMSSYVSLINGPRRSPEDDGPQELHLIIMDNGRTRILADPELRESLHCIRCGACLNVCPVYQQVGGHAYGWVYSGPIGSVITPQYVGLEKAAPLPFASSLCGACKDVCPVRIDIPHLLLKLRHKLSSGPERARGRLGERWLFRLWEFMMRSPGRYKAAGKLAAILQRPLVRRGRIAWLPGPFGAWTQYRDFPPLAARPFRDRWRSLEQESHD